MILGDKGNLKELARQIINELRSGNASSAYDYHLDAEIVKQSRDTTEYRVERRELLRNMVSAVGFFLTGMSTVTAIPFLEEIADPQIDSKEADGLYSLFTGYRLNVPELTGKRSKVASAFYIPVISARQGGHVAEDVISALIELALSQDQPETCLVLLNISCKIALLNGARHLAIDALRNAESRSDIFLNRGGRLLSHETLYVSQQFSTIYGSLDENDLRHPKSSNRLKQLGSYIEQIDNAYNFRNTRKGCSFNIDPASFETDREIDLACKAEMYRILYDLRTGKKLDEIGRDKEIAQYVFQIALARDEYNPKESLHVLSPIAIALLEANYKLAALIVSNWAELLFTGKSSHPLSNMQKVAVEQKAAYSLEYLVHQVCRAQVLDGQIVSAKYNKEKLTTYKEICKIPDSNINVSTFRSLKADFRALLKRREDSKDTSDANIILSASRARVSHRSFFVLDGPRLLRNV